MVAVKYNFTVYARVLHFKEHAKARSFRGIVFVLTYKSNFGYLRHL